MTKPNLIGFKNINRITPIVFGIIGVLMFFAVLAALKIMYVIPYQDDNELRFIIQFLVKFALLIMFFAAFIKLKSITSNLFAVGAGLLSMTSVQKIIRDRLILFSHLCEA